MADFSDLDISTLIERIDVLLDSLKGYDDLTDNEVAFMIQSEQIKEWLWIERDVAFARSLAEPNEFQEDRSEEFSQRFMNEIHGISSGPYPPEAIRLTFGKYFGGTAYIRPILQRRLVRPDSRVSARKTRPGYGSSNPPSVPIAGPRTSYSQERSSIPRPTLIFASPPTPPSDIPLQSRSNSPTPADANVPHALSNDTETTPGAAAAVPAHSTISAVAPTFSPSRRSTSMPRGDVRSHSSTHRSSPEGSPPSKSAVKLPPEVSSSSKISNRNTGPTPIVITPMRAVYPYCPSNTSETSTSTCRTAISTAKGKAPDLTQGPSPSADSPSRGQCWGLEDAEPEADPFAPRTSTVSMSSSDYTTTPYLPQAPSSSTVRSSGGGSTSIVSGGKQPSSSSKGIGKSSESPSPIKFPSDDIIHFTDDLLQKVASQLNPFLQRGLDAAFLTKPMTPPFVPAVFEPNPAGLRSPPPHQPVASRAPSSGTYATTLLPHGIPESDGLSVAQVAHPPPPHLETPTSQSQIPQQRSATPPFEIHDPPSVISEPLQLDLTSLSASPVEVPQITSPSHPRLEIYAAAGPSRPWPEVKVLTYSDDHDDAPSSPLSGSDVSSIIDMHPIDRPEAPRNDLVQCSICFEDTPPEESFESPCSHIYCADCVERFVENFTRDETLFPFRCCQESIAPQDVVPFIPDSLRILFNEKIAEYSVAVRFRLYCHSQPCSVFLGSYPPIVIRRNSITSVRCSECHLLTCPKCKQLAHPEEPECREHAAAVELRRLARGLGWQKCSSCKWLVERTDGCNHLVCRCGYQFCYACAKPWRAMHDCSPNTDYA